MKNKLRNLFLGLLVAVSAAAPAWGYVYSSHQSVWTPGPIPMQIRLGSGTTLSDGTNHSSSVQQAIQAWNGYLGTVQFVPQIVAAGGQEDFVNDIYFDSTIEGDAFGSGVLAVTLSYTSPSIFEIIESDIIFNTAWTWDSYRGNLQVPEDIRRVALHELGHVLGLTHPDENGQSITALMNSTVSDLDELAPDDIAGAQSIYRAPGQTSGPANDSFASATVISLTSGSTQVAGSNVYATKEPGEPNHAAGAGGASAWWRWTAPASGDMTVTTQGSKFDTLLGIYTGPAVSSLALVASNDDVTPEVIRYSSVTFAATSGVTYQIAVDGWDGASGPITLNLTFTPPVVATAPSITGQPSNQSVIAGQTAQFSVSSSGSPPPSYQWQRLPVGGGAWANLSNGGNYAGVTNTTLSVNGTTEAMNGDQFRCVASNGAGSDTSGAALLAVTALPVITQQPVSQLVLVGATANYSISATSSVAFSFQWQRLPAGSGTWFNLGNTGSYAGVTSAALTVSDTTLAMSGDQFRCVVTNSAGGTSSNVANLTVSAPPAITSAGTISIGAGGTFTYNITATNSPNSYGATGLPAGLVLNTGNGLISGTATTPGVFNVTLNATNPVGTGAAILTITVTDAPPVVLTQTSGRISLSPGGGTTLAVSGFSANGAIGFQWMHNGRPVPGAIGSSLNLSNATRAEGGAYWV